MNKAAFYDNTISYEANYEKGPPISSQKVIPPKRNIAKKSKHLGFEVNLPFGIPPGPLLNSKFIKEAFAWGFDISTYKTVRSNVFPCHPFPNVLYVDIDGDLHPEKTPTLVAKPTTSKSQKDFSITNSFGVPSQAPEIWQEDVRKAISYEGNGQLMILSFMGTVWPDQTRQDFITDHALSAKLANETGAKVLEVNLSCPNLGNEGLVCYDLSMTAEVCKMMRKEIGNKPLILKVGYYTSDKDIQRLSEIANEYANAVAAINTLQVEVVDESGKQALPGSNRARSGICGASIKWAGLEMTKKLREIREKKNYSFEIVGIGGVMTAEDYKEYRDAGADCVQSATGAMWNPNLAYDVWKSENKV